MKRINKKILSEARDIILEGTSLFSLVITSLSYLIIRILILLKLVPEWKNTVLNYMWGESNGTFVNNLCQFILSVWATYPFYLSFLYLVCIFIFLSVCKIIDKECKPFKDWRILCILFSYLSVWITFAFIEIFY